MKIAICASAVFASRILEVARQLEATGHQVYVPGPLEAKTRDVGPREAAEKKIKGDLIRRHWEKIRASDAILVLNFEKDAIANYVGGNSFLEMGFAHVLGKRIYMLNPIPEAPYAAEMMAMKPVVLYGDLRNLEGAGLPPEEP